MNVINLNAKPSFRLKSFHKNQKNKKPRNIIKLEEIVFETYLQSSVSLTDTYDITITYEDKENGNVLTGIYQYWASFEFKKRDFFGYDIIEESIRGQLVVDLEKSGYFVEKVSFEWQI